MARVTLHEAVRVIDRLGACLVYPLDNRPEPKSLWHAFHPRTPMRWEWDAGGDDRVPRLWSLREELSRSGRVVYLKWYQGRATFFARELFRDYLAERGTRERPFRAKSARALYDALLDESPLSTKELKLAADLKGRDNEAEYTRGLKELWERGWIVGWGEKDDGAFPSLLVGATRHLFEDLWREAETTDPAEARARLEGRWPLGSGFRRFWDRVRREARDA